MGGAEKIVQVLLTTSSPWKELRLVAGNGLGQTYRS